MGPSPDTYTDNLDSPAGGANPPATPAGGAPTEPEAGLAETTSTAPAQAPQYPLEDTGGELSPAEKRIQGENWGTRVYHGVLNALGGGGDVSYSRDPKTGKMQATPVATGPGTQWKKIIAGALSGFSAAAAAGTTGPGAAIRGAGAGVTAGMKMAQQRQQMGRDQANEDFEAQQKAATQSAQIALLSHQIAKSTFELGREQVTAAVEDSDRETNFEKVIADGGAGSVDMGVFPDFQSVIKAFQEVPSLHDHQAGGRIVAIPHINGKGQVDGIHAALVSPDWLNTKINRDMPITVRSFENGKMTENTFTIPANSLTGQQYVNMVQAQSQQAIEDWTKTAHANAETSDAAERAKLTPSEIAKNNAEAARDRAEIDKDLEAGGAGLVDEIGTGKMAVGRLAYVLARKPELMEAVAKKYPDFDGSKVDSYVATYKDFTSGKTSIALNAGETALKHLAELQELNTVASHLPHTSAWTAYQNKADTVSAELGRFYGTDTVPGIQHIKDTLTSTLPGNRNAAITTQAKSMGDKLDSFEQQWRNAAPSAQYQAQMPGIDAAAKEARARLDPSYAARFQNGGRPAAAQIKVQPGEPTAKGANGETLVVRNGQWVTAQP